MDDVKNIPRLIRTFVINLEFLALGVLQATPGPTLLDLQARVHSTSHEIAFILVACLAGALLGSLVDMVLNKKVNRELLMGIYSMIIGLAHFVCPWWTTLTPLIISMAVSGVFNGALNGGSNIFCLNLWGKRSRPLLQALHSCFALGTFIAPLVTEPFLVEESLVVGQDIPSNSTVPESLATVPYLIYYPYGFGSALMWISSVGFLVMYLTRPQNFSKVSLPKVAGAYEPSFLFKSIAVALSMFLSALASALDLTTGTYLTTFAVKCGLRLSKSTGSLITSAYWGSFTLGRLITIPLASKLSPLKLLLLNVFLCNVSGIILGGWSDFNEGALWAGSAIMGLGVSSMSPNVLSWMESCGSASGFGTSLFVVSAFTGALTLPLIIGFYVDGMPMIFMYTLVACAILSTFGMVVCSCMSWHYNKRNKDEKPTNKDDQVLSSADVDAVMAFKMREFKITPVVEGKNEEKTTPSKSNQ